MQVGHGATVGLRSHSGACCLWRVPSPRRYSSSQKCRMGPGIGRRGGSGMPEAVVTSRRLRRDGLGAVVCHSREALAADLQTRRENQTKK